MLRQHHTMNIRLNETPHPWKNVRKIDIDKEESFPPLDLIISPPFYSYIPIHFAKRISRPIKSFLRKKSPHTSVGADTMNGEGDEVHHFLVQNQRI